MLGGSFSEPALQQPPARFHGQGRRHSHSRPDRSRKKGGQARLCREDSSWSVHSVSGRFVPGVKEKVYSDSSGLFYDPDGKIAKRKKTPQTQIMLVPVSLAPATKEADTTGSKEEAKEEPLDQTQARAVSAIGRRRFEEKEQSDVISREIPSACLEVPVHIPIQHESDGQLELHKPRQAFLGPLAPETEVKAEVEHSAIQRRFSLSRTAESWVQQRRRSTSEEPRGTSSAERETSPEDKVVGHTLKDWFESADRDRTSSSLSGQSSLRGPMKSPASTSSGPIIEIETAEKRVAKQAELKREAIRRELIKSVGGPMEAFRMIDLSGSGSISQTEFADGLYRIGVDWQELSGSSKILEVFRLFDRDKNGTISMEELFPEERYAVDGEFSRMSTPEFWNHWCRKTTNSKEVRPPKWAVTSDEEMSAMLQTQDYRQDVADERRRMRAMIRRLQKQGKSDARCRECVATHLPRGTGPKDRESVLTFSEAEVRTCRRTYNEATSGHVRNISKNVYEMRESKRVLQSLSHKFKEQVMKSKQSENQFEGLHLFGSSHDHSQDSPSNRSDLASLLHHGSDSPLKI